MPEIKLNLTELELSYLEDALQFHYNFLEDDGDKKGMKIMNSIAKKLSFSGF